MKSVMECVRDYIMQFPELKDGCLMVDYLGSEGIEYTVDSVPCDPIYKRYTDGGCLKQFQFVFASREFYGADVLECIANLGFYEKFEDWIMRNNLNGVLPDLDGRNAIFIEPTTKAYLFSADENLARYQIQLRLVYEE